MGFVSLFSIFLFTFITLVDCICPSFILYNMESPIYVMVEFTRLNIIREFTHDEFGEGYVQSLQAD